MGGRLDVLPFGGRDTGSELSGKAGRLEVHHRVRLEDGGDPYSLDNLMVLTRAEHIEIHRGDRETPGRAQWRALIRELM